MTDVSRETIQRLERYASLLLEENQKQNLVAKSSEPDLWKRHIEDALQLVPLIKGGSIIDVGSGPGLPGLVLAIATGLPTTLVEPRRLRVEFLERCKADLALDNITIILGKSQLVRGPFDTITARAVAELSTLIGWTWHLAHSGTRFVLPKGRSAQSELESAIRAWQGGFRLEPSLTSDDAWIVVADGVKPRGRDDPDCGGQSKGRGR